MSSATFNQFRNWSRSRFIQGNLKANFEQEPKSSIIVQGSQHSFKEKYANIISLYQIFGKLFKN